MKTNNEWISISDMMSGLMMVFLFISVVFMQKVNDDKQSMVDIAEAYADTRNKLNAALHTEFDNDLNGWGAEILEDNTIRFKEPDVLFDRNKAVLKNKFKFILDDFFPRYTRILTSDDFVNDIIELRVEGHTSSEWRPNSTVEVAYLNNARLSQDRAFSVLSYTFTLPSTKQHQKWLVKVFRANGLAFAKKIIVDGKEDLSKSRRVEFRVITNTEQRIEDILKRARSITNI